MADEKKKSPAPERIRIGRIFPERPALQGPVKFAKPDPKKAPSMGELIMEGLGNFLGAPGEVDLFAEPDLSPRGRAMRNAAGIGSLAGMLNPASVKKILSALKMPTRMAKTAGAFEALKADHPYGVAHFSDIGQSPAGFLAAMEPIPAVNMQGTNAVPVPVQAPDAPVFDMKFTRHPRDIDELRHLQATGEAPTVDLPGRLTLRVSDLLEDFDPSHIYGVLRHEANHAAQARLTKGELLPRYVQANNKVGYFDNPFEATARFAGYKGTARNELKQPLTREQIQILRALADDQMAFRRFAPSGFLMNPSGFPDLIRELLGETQQRLKF